MKICILVQKDGNENFENVFISEDIVDTNRVRIKFVEGDNEKECQPRAEIAKNETVICDVDLSGY